MKVVPYSSEMRPQWDDFVCSHPWAFAGHETAHFEIERGFGGINCSLVVLDAKDQIIGIVPMFLFRKTLPFGLRERILVSGSTLRSGPLFQLDLPSKIKSKATDKVVAALIKEAEKRKVDLIHISYHNTCFDKTSIETFRYYPLKQYGFEDKTGVTLIVDLRLPEKTLFENIYPKCRNKVRRAQREGVTIEPVEKYEDWMACYPLNVETFRNEKNTKPFTKTFWENVWHHFIEPGIARVFIAKYDEEIHSAAVIVGRGTSAYYWLGFNSEKLPIPGMGNLLQWEIIRWLKSKKKLYYEMGSVEFSDKTQKALSAFKESFGGDTYISLSGQLHFKPAKLAFVQLLRELKRHLPSLR